MSTPRASRHRSLWGLLLVPATLLPAAAEQAGPRTGCVLQSTVLKEARIQLSPSRTVAGAWSGHLIVRGRRLRPIRLSKFQGYGDLSWSDPTAEGRGDLAIAFSRGQPSRSLSRAVPVDALLFVGLGFSVYDMRKSDNPPITRAAEGFWRVGDGCSDRMIFNR